MKIKRIIFWVTLTLLTVGVHGSIGKEAPVEAGIRFETVPNWQTLVEKARRENKFILVVCSASWCTICKRMEREVFPKKEVGDFINAHFLSVNLQMDTTKNDGEFVKSWYPDAHRLRDQFKVDKFPTYLFFSPDGTIVHRYLFGMNDSLFMRVAGNALNPDRQYYPRLERYLKGGKDYAVMGSLAIVTKEIGDDSLARVVALEYLHDYLDKKPESLLQAGRGLQFVSTFQGIIRSDDGIFDVFMHNWEKLDSLVGRKGFSKSMVLGIIAKEEINPILWPDHERMTGEPDWKGLTKRIRTKFGEDLCAHAILDARLRWFSEKKDWPKMIECTVKKIEYNELDTSGIGWALISNMAEDLFLRHCNNADTLNRVIRVMEGINAAHLNEYISMDIYANLLYKAGRRKEALYWEEQAVKVEKETAITLQKPPTFNCQAVLEKMKKGSLAWEN